MVNFNPSICVLVHDSYIPETYDKTIAYYDAIKNKGQKCKFILVQVDNLEKDLRIISQKKPTLKVTMFNSFDCFINNHIVTFSSSKSKELFALLLALNGKSLTMSQAITCLWPDKDIEKAKVLYRDAVWRLRSTLEEIEFPCVDFQRALLVLDKSNIKCDYYDFLNGKKKIANEAFLQSYDWSYDFESEIALINQERK